jgi:hypothetical protein
LAPTRFEQREIGIRFDVTSDAGVAVPVPGAAEVTGRIDHADPFDARLSQSRTGEQSAEAATDHHHLDLIEQRLAFEAGLDIGIVEVVGELLLDLDVLLVAVVAQAPVALRSVAGPQRVGVEAELRALLYSPGVQPGSKPSWIVSLARRGPTWPHLRMWGEGCAQRDRASGARHGVQRA